MTAIVLAVSSLAPVVITVICAASVLRSAKNFLRPA